MSTPRVLLIGGTADSRAVARALTAAGVEVVASAATAYGAELAAGDATTARSGALDAAGMAELATDSVAIVDASHPFARAVSETAREAAAIAGLAYVRFERETGESGAGAIVCDSAESAAAAAVEAAGPGGTVLLTVGSRSVGVYVEACRAAGVRCVARVLPVAESLAACSAAGLGPADIIGMQGPSSALLDAALLRHLGASVLVTKDSGDIGGVPEKLEAARLTGAIAIVVARPAAIATDAVHTAADVVERVCALAAGGPESVAAEAAAENAEEPVPQGAAPSRTGLVHVYTGDGKGKTTAGVGLAVRAAGAGLRVAFVQFVKGGAPSSELESLRRLGVAVTRPAKRSSGLMRNTITDDDRNAADAAFAAAREALSGAYDVVVLDEVCVAARTGLVNAAALVSAVSARPESVEVVMTGRGAPEALTHIADYVTEMRPHKHPYERGISARKGVEF